ncbi:alginate export family protein, partial [Salmonella enterica]|nr:alginate export family protein [Salmonella enterica]
TLDIRAWTLATDTGLRWTELPLQPRLGLKADIASGDGNLHDGRLGTFNALFPKSAYFSEASLLAPANLMDVQPTLTLRLHDAVTT